MREVCALCYAVSLQRHKLNFHVCARRENYRPFPPRPHAPPTPRPHRTPQYQTGTSPFALQMSYISQQLSKTVVISWPDIVRNILNGTAALISLPTRRDKHYVQHKHLMCRQLSCYMPHPFYCSL